MGRTLGKPKENQRRNLTPKERAILLTDKPFIVEGTKEGFQLYDSNGRVQTITELEKAKLGYYWGIPAKYPWDIENKVFQ